MDLAISRHVDWKPYLFQGELVRLGIEPEKWVKSRGRHYDEHQEIFPSNRAECRWCGLGVNYNTESAFEGAKLEGKGKEWELTDIG